MTFKGNNVPIISKFYLFPPANAALPSDEQRVINYILKDYIPTARPADPNTTVNVTFGIEIVQLVNVVSTIFNKHINQNFDTEP